MDDSKKLKGKDLINIGIFTAIYFVVIMALAMLGFIPIFMPTYSVLMPLLGGIVFMFFLTKVKKFGMVWIMTILMGILMWLTGMSYYALVIGTVTGLIAELNNAPSTILLPCGKPDCTPRLNKTFAIFNFLLSYYYSSSPPSTRCHLKRLSRSSI